MLKMSFMEGTLDKDKAKEFIKNTDKDLVYTYGYEFKNPTTHRVSISKERAIDIIDCESLLDITEETNCIHLNAFSGNDMW